MLTLIKREMEDHYVYFIAGVIFSAIMVGILVSMAFTGFAETVMALLTPVACIVLIGSASLGAAQMYTDRANKITSFLSTLAITRAQILAARFIVGLIAILVALLPGIITAVVLLSMRYPPLMFYGHVVVEAVTAAFLLALSCYCVGLLMGWTTSKILPAAACLLYPPFITTLLVAKGFGLEAIAILGVLILASVACIWAKFSSTPL